MSVPSAPTPEPPEAAMHGSPMSLPPNEQGIPPMPGGTRPRAPALRWRVSAAVALLLAAACGPDPADGDEAIDRETFIDVQVDLHLAAADREPEALSAADRDRILAEHGVTEEELAAFVSVHGSDELYMQDLWAEVDRRVVEARGGGEADPGDTVSSTGPDGWRGRGVALA